MNKIKILAITLCTLLVTHSSAFAAPPNYTGVAKICDLQIVFTRVVQVSGALLGFAFFVMVIIGGIKFLLSGGDPKTVQEAKGTLTWGVLGLAFFALSFTILLLIEAFTGVPVSIFRIGNC